MPVVEEISTITRKGQTTIPKAVRRALGVDYGGMIAFRVDEHGVSVHRKEEEAEHQDPVLDKFLAFLAKDMEQRPDGLKPLSQAFVDRVNRLTEGVEVDLDSPIEGEIDL